MRNETTGKKTASLAGKWHLKFAKALEADGISAWIYLGSKDIKELQSVCGSALTQTPNKVKAKVKK